MAGERRILSSEKYLDGRVYKRSDFRSASHNERRSGRLGCPRHLFVRQSGKARLAEAHDQCHFERCQRGRRVAHLRYEANKNRTHAPQSQNTKAHRPGRHSFTGVAGDHEPRKVSILAPDSNREDVSQFRELHKIDSPSAQRHTACSLMNRYADGLHEGMQVARGDIIGYVGSTGDADARAPHLHFSVFELGPAKEWWKGKPINPYLNLVEAVRELSGL